MPTDAVVRSDAVVLPDALVFDFDGTLVDTETAEYESVRMVFADHGIHYPPERWHPYVGTLQSVPWLAELEHAVGRPLHRDRLHRRARAYNRELIATVAARSGVLTLLDAAARAGVALGVASNAPGDWVEGHLDRLGMLGWFGAIVTVDRVARGKPDPEPYETACALLGAQAACSVAFEDSTTGLAAALAAGLYTIAVPGPMSDGHELDGAHELHESLDRVTIEALGRALARRAQPHSN